MERSPPSPAKLKMGRCRRCCAAGCSGCPGSSSRPEPLAELLGLSRLLLSRRPLGLQQAAPLAAAAAAAAAAGCHRCSARPARLVRLVTWKVRAGSTACCRAPPCRSAR